MRYSPTSQQQNKESASVPLTYNTVKLTITGTSPTPANTQVVEAVAGVGSGLAYHLATGWDTPSHEHEAQAESEKDEEEGGEDYGGYILTHIASGRCLGKRTVDTPRQARAWLEGVATLCEWQKELKEFASHPQALFALAQEVEKIRKLAVEASIFVEEA